MNYKEAINYVEGTGKFSINLGLDRIKRMCEIMGNPERNLKVIHVAGTNGKGSTTTFISSVLIKQGYRVGIYTSPYIERFTERIKINDKEIGEDEVAKLVTDLKPIIDRVEQDGLERPTEFEIITAAALKYFNDEEVDFVVLEVGLGGRYDATNVIDPLLSVITTISYDHINILGDTLGKIAFEKAGIIKNNRPVVIYPQAEEVMEVLLEEAKKHNAYVNQVGDIKYEIVKDTIDGIEFNVNSKNEYNGLKITMTGSYQVMNALTALCSIETLINEGVVISRDAVYEGFLTAKWPGRFEVLYRQPYIILDGGHNIQGIDALVASTKKYFPDMKATVICGMLRDKEYNSMLDKLSEVSEEFITLRANSDRALTEIELSNILIEKGKRACPAANVQEAVEKVISAGRVDDIFIFCGSLYMIGEARSKLKVFFK